MYKYCKQLIGGQERKGSVFRERSPNKKKIHIALDPRHIRTHSGWCERATQKGDFGDTGLDSTEPLLASFPRDGAPFQLAFPWVSSRAVIHIFNTIMTLELVPSVKYASLPYPLPNKNKFGHRRGEVLFKKTIARDSKGLLQCGEGAPPIL